MGGLQGGSALARLDLGGALGVVTLAMAMAMLESAHKLLRAE